MTNVAALPWYSFPSTRAGLDAVWQEARSILRLQGIEPLPTRLNHCIAYRQLFSDECLVLSQCCGLDLFQPQTDNVIPLAVPRMTALDVSDGYYFSYIVTRKFARLDRPRVVVNSRCSHSGHTAIRSWLDANSKSEFTLHTSGSHTQSVLALQSGAADLAAIDALSWQHIETTGLIVLDTSEPAPAPPFIVGKQSMIPKGDLFVALDSAFARFGHGLGITGLLPYHSERYARMVQSAKQQGILSVDIEMM